MKITAPCRELAATGERTAERGEMIVHAALIESLLAVPNALWYCSPSSALMGAKIEFSAGRDHFGSIRVE